MVWSERESELNKNSATAKKLLSHRRGSLSSRLSACAMAGISVLTFWACESEAQTIPSSVAKFFDTINDDSVTLNLDPIVIGDETAPTTAILFYSLSCTDTAYFFKRVFPDIQQDYIDTKKLRVIMYEYPLGWRDMQIMAGMRCVPKDKYQAAVFWALDPQSSFVLKLQHASLDSVPGITLPILKKYGLSEDEALKCMANSEALGVVEGLRRVAVEDWGVNETPILVIDGVKYTQAQFDSSRKFYDVMKRHAK